MAAHHLKPAMGCWQEAPELASQRKLPAFAEPLGPHCEMMAKRMIKDSMNSPAASSPPLDRGMLTAYRLARFPAPSGEPPTLAEFMAEFDARRRQALSLLLEQTPQASLRLVGENGMRREGFPLERVVLPQEWLGTSPPTAAELAADLLAAANLARPTSSADQFKLSEARNHNALVALRCSRNLRNMLNAPEGLEMLADAILSMSLALSAKDASPLKATIFSQMAALFVEAGPKALPAFAALATPPWSAAATALLSGEPPLDGSGAKVGVLGLAFGGQFRRHELFLGEALFASQSSPAKALDMAAVFSLLNTAPWGSCSELAASSTRINGAASDAELLACKETFHDWMAAGFRWPSAFSQGAALFYQMALRAALESWPEIVASNEREALGSLLLDPPAPSTPRSRL